MATDTHDKEIEQYRSLLETPSEFKEGFGWTTVAGIIFCGLIMMPGGIFLGLMTGHNLGMAASWVTVILFMEIARRALQPALQTEPGDPVARGARDDGRSCAVSGRADGAPGLSGLLCRK